MDNISLYTTICQCLNRLGFDDYHSIFDVHYARKLNTGNCIQLHVVGQLLGLESYGALCEQLRASKELQNLTGLEHISDSALSRKTNQLCTESLQDLFLHLVSTLQTHIKAKSCKVKPSGTLHLIDSTDIVLPRTRAAWANHGTRLRGVKMHTRVVVADPDHIYPDRMVATTADVHDIPMSIELVQDPDAIYLLDRGYQKHAHYDRWTRENIRFLTRLKNNTLYEILETYETDEPNILLDAKVMLRKSECPIRLVLAKDENEKVYYLVTNLLVEEYSALEISELYRSRWLIELFFKWIKQHLRLVKVFSYTPTGIWNQLYFTLIAYVLCQIVQLETGTEKTQWDVLKFIRVYADRSWDLFKAALVRKPTRTSKGRQKKAEADPPLNQPLRIIVK